MQRVLYSTPFIVVLLLLGFGLHILGMYGMVTYEGKFIQEKYGQTQAHVLQAQFEQNDSLIGPGKSQMTHAYRLRLKFKPQGRDSLEQSVNILHSHSSGTSAVTMPFPLPKAGSLLDIRYLYTEPARICVAQLGCRIDRFVHQDFPEGIARPWHVLPALVLGSLLLLAAVVLRFIKPRPVHHVAAH